MVKRFVTEKLTPDEVRTNSCEGKERFKFYGLANAIARNQSKRHQSRYQAYRCRFCGGWHTGESQAKRKPNLMPIATPEEMEALDFIENKNR